MNYTKKIMFLCFLSVLCCHAGVPQKQGRLRTFFSKPRPTETTTKEYMLQAPKSISVVNPYGSITIASAWKKPILTIEATKTAKLPEQLHSFRIEERRASPTDIELCVVADNNPKNCAVDLVLVCPEQAKLMLTTSTGDIVTNHLKSDVTATTNQGAIKLEDIHGCIVAETKKNGSIRIQQVCGNIRATTERGPIVIHDSTESVIATTKRGPINVSCKALPSTGKLQVASQSGSIDVKLPSHVNADLTAKAKKGTVICEHPVKIREFTAVWTNRTWNQLKREICGTLGSGEAIISLQNQRGNIKIRKHAA